MQSALSCGKIKDKLQEYKAKPLERTVMGKKIISLQGTQDLLPEDTKRWQYVERTALETAESFGFGEIRTPTIEYTELFQRSVGDTTDVVQKEMYTFKDRGDREICLKPEGTSGVVRAAIERGLLGGNLPVKLSYITRCYRAERPQRGRYREFNQFGVEAIGTASPVADAEIIALANRLLARLELKDYSLNINSIGCPACRPAYQAKLLAYFSEHKDKLCGTCLERLEKNPLRIIDCKHPECKKIAATAPRMVGELCEDCSTHFEKVKELLTAIGIDYSIDPNIVRGLDYYTKTVFEFITKTSDGELTLCGGGRYDGLSEMLGGPNAPGIGFGMGMERLILTLMDNGCPLPAAEPCQLYFAPMSEAATLKAAMLADQLRSENISCEQDCVGRSLKAQMRYANKIGAVYTMVLGDDELSAGVGKLKRMSDGTITDIRLDDSFGEAFATIAISDSLQDLM